MVVAERKVRLKMPNGFVSTRSCQGSPPSAISGARLWCRRDRGNAEEDATKTIQSCVQQYRNIMNIESIERICICSELAIEQSV